jgi:hypothetical protein
MIVTPVQLLVPILFGLLALGLLVAAVFLLLRIRRVPVIAEPVPGRVVVRSESSVRLRRPHPALVALAIVLLLLPVFGRHVISLIRPSANDAPQDEFGPVTRRITGPSGADLAIGASGPRGSPGVIFTHGWGGGPA